MDDEQFAADLLSTSGGDVERIIDALARGAKEHNLTVTVTIMFSPNDEWRAAPPPERE